MRTLAAVLAVPLIACHPALALPEGAKVPVLTYHSWELRWDPHTETCDLEATALAQDLEVLYDLGWTVVPASWIAQWVAGTRSGDGIPNKAVVLTFDDGHDSDFLDNALPWHPCAPIPSMRAVLEEAATWDWGAPEGMPVPHATTFVIASPTARQYIAAGNMSHNWWPAAAAHPLLEVQNHGTDHDHESIPQDTWDSALELSLPVGGGEPEMSSTRIDTALENQEYYGAAASFIYQQSGAGPDLTAYPFGPASEYTKLIYMPNEPNTVAAFCGPNLEAPYVTKSSDLYCLPRFIHRATPQYGGWRNSEELRILLKGAEVPNGKR